MTCCVSAAIAAGSPLPRRWLPGRYQFQQRARFAERIAAGRARKTRFRRLSCSCPCRPRNRQPIACSRATSPRAEASVVGGRRGVKLVFQFAAGAVERTIDKSRQDRLGLFARHAADCGLSRLLCSLWGRQQGKKYLLNSPSDGQPFAHSPRNFHKATKRIFHGRSSGTLCKSHARTCPDRHRSRSPALRK
jgi:hypothetical protein